MVRLIPMFIGFALLCVGVAFIVERMGKEFTSETIGIIAGLIIFGLIFTVWGMKSKPWERF